MEQETLYIASISGGKDSSALYLLMMEYHGNNFLPVFADTGHEHPVTVNYVRNMHHMTGGPKVEMCKADFSKKLEKKGIEPTGNGMLDLSLWKGRAPSSKAQFCTEWLKPWPIKLFLHNNYPNHKWVMHTGVRREESKRRSTKEPFDWNGYFDCLDVRPWLYETEKYMFKMMEEKGLPPNPLYALGNNRVGCFPCIHSNKKQLQVLPDWAWDRLQYYEDTLGRSWFSPGILPGKPDKYVPVVSEIREWAKTTHGGRNYDLFKQDTVEDAPSCFSTWHECE